ncbi:ABC transporter permease [Natronosalvus halobius]|uniref:ABC transporter permease n=1 Tax=Natronosalvus halobius TaxID=2953746 RepID=UPI0020A0B7D7|nr:ABC transporter permease [Natronosalvus halobius]USZ70884.1 ABC transporter permease [Natronosalvus halobius]
MSGLDSLEYARHRGVRLVGLVLVMLAALGVVGAVVFDVPLAEVLSDGLETLASIVTPGYVARSMEMAAPITLAAIGGLYAEKSGVFNIGLEGFMIFGAFFAAAATYFVGAGGAVHAWVGIVISVLLTMGLAVLFAVLLIRYKADQIVAGLGVWFIGLGLVPFTAAVIWGSRNSPRLPGVGRLTVPGLSEIPFLGRVVFDQSPLVWLTVLVAVGAWVFLYRTQYGYWIQAAGENPEALDTAGIDVNRVRYATVIFSGGLAGLGGAVLLAHSSSFIGTGQTMVDGRGWLGIVAYLFGNYNPLGAAAAALLFGGVDMLQGQFQTLNIEASSKLLGLLPYVVVIVVLTGWGKTQVPSSVGEPYESEE